MVQLNQLAALCPFGYHISEDTHLHFTTVSLPDYIKAIMQQQDINTLVSAEVLAEIVKRDKLVILLCYPTETLQIRVVHYNKQMAIEEAYKHIKDGDNKN